MNTVGRDSNSVQIKGYKLPRVVKQAIININTAGDNIIVPVVLLAKVRVLARWYRSNGSVIVTPKSGVGITATTIGGPDTLKEGYGVSDCWSPNYFYETLEGEALNFYLSANVQVSGELNYIEI
jgi:hypothetical protein